MRLKTIFILILLLAAAGTGIYFFMQYQYGNEISQLESMMRRGKYEDIIERLQPQINLDTSSPRKRELLAEALYRSEKYADVDGVLDPLLRYGAETAPSLSISGWSNLKRGEYLLATERFNRLQQQYPEKSAWSESGKGAAALVRSERFRRKDLDEAQLFLSQSVDEANIAEAHLYLTEYYLITHNYSEAVNEALKASAMQPYWAEPYMALGRCYLQNGQYSKAEDSFKQSLALGAGETGTNYYLARSMYQQGRLSESLAVFEPLSSTGAAAAVKAAEDAAKIYVAMGNLSHAVTLLEPLAVNLANPSAAMQLFEIYTRQGEDAKAAKLLQDVINKWPLSNDAQLELGNRQLRDGQWKEAGRTLQNVTDDDPKHFWANYNLGCIYVQQGQLFQAPDYFDVANQFAEDFFAAKVNHALSLLAVGRDLEGRMKLQELYYAHENNPVIMLAQALERFLAGFPEVSLQRIEQSIQVLHDQAVPYLIRGEIYLRLYQFEPAKENFQQAVALQPNNIRAQLGLAHVLFRLGEYHNAGTHYNVLLMKESELTQPIKFEVMNGSALLKAVNGEMSAALDIWDAMKFESPLGRQFSLINRSVAPGHQPSTVELEDLKTGLSEPELLPELLFNIGVLSLQAGDRNAAVTMYQRLNADYPTFLPAFFNLASFNEQQRRFSEAANQYETAHRAAPNHIDILNNLAAAYVYLGDLNQAKERLATASAVEEENPLIEANRILVALEQNDIEGAKEQFKVLKNIVGDAPVASAMNGLFEAQEKNWQNALQSFSTARQNGDRNVYTYINNAVALAKLNRMEEAETLLLQARAMEPRSPGVHKALGILYSQMGLYAEAQTALQTSLSIAPDQADVQHILQQINKWMG